MSSIKRRTRAEHNGRSRDLSCISHPQAAFEDKTDIEQKKLLKTVNSTRTYLIIA